MMDTADSAVFVPLPNKVTVDDDNTYMFPMRK